MKKVIIICCLLGFITNILLSQIPDGFSYQAVIRDNDNSLLKNQSVTVEASILRGEEVIFTQIIEGKTNENGLLSLTIGGTPEFGEIDWTDGQLFIQTRIDTMGGSDFAIETTTQLMSVPYSMAAQMAVDVPGLELLKERINMLEEQMDEIYTLLGINIDLPYEEYSLTGTGCRWTPSYYPINSKIIIINSNEELKNNITCIEDDFPEIDFTKKSLLLAIGVMPYGINNISKSLQKILLNKYVLKIGIQSNDILGVKYWNIALVIDKLNNECTVELNVKTNGITSTICEVNNPLLELEWMNDRIISNENNVEEGFITHYRIFKCNYMDGTTCFLINDCLNCTDGSYILTNCTGEKLCYIGGWGAGCDEYNIDYENNILIWENPPYCIYENPITDLPWLKNVIEEYSLSGSYQIQILKCTYSDLIYRPIRYRDTGFIIFDINSGDYGLFDCNGKYLCDYNSPNYNFCEFYYIDETILVWKNY